MIVVNLFGAPGAGKSTGAARIFSNLKMAGINAELVTEFAKDKVWEENKAVFNDQLYIFGKQNFKLTRIKDKVDVAITDSPILLSMFYNKDYGDNFNKLVKEVFNSYNNINFFINRVKKYNPVGRFQDEHESNKLANELKIMLLSNSIPFVEANGDFTDYDNKITSQVIQMVNNENIYN